MRKSPSLAAAPLVFMLGCHPQLREISQPQIRDLMEEVAVNCHGVRMRAAREKGDPNGHIVARQFGTTTEEYCRCSTNHCDHSKTVERETVCFGGPVRFGFHTEQFPCTEIKHKMGSLLYFEDQGYLSVSYQTGEHAGREHRYDKRGSVSLEAGAVCSLQWDYETNYTGTPKKIQGASNDMALCNATIGRAEEFLEALNRVGESK